MGYFKKTILFFLLTVFCAVSPAYAQDVVLIANSDVPVDSLSSSDVKNIFLGKKTDWGNGSKIVFFTLKEADTNKAFLKSYVGKSSTQFKTFWKKQVFTGKGKLPKSAGSDQDMVSLVTSTSNAIGYVSASADLGSAKTLTIN